MLWRALRHVENGFYIDVGANDPVDDSVTFSFYQRGWRGVNVEPLQCHFDDLQRARPRDVNLLCAAGAFAGEVDLIDFDVRGWATADPAAMADHRAHGKDGVAVKVPVMTLTTICQLHAPSDIHFLKIDVEGYEAAVLEGMDFAAFRPWIVVVEAVRPNSGAPMHEQWEHRLLGANYGLAYRDGLNRFYLAAEHPELASAFEFPPNVFDDFVKAAQKAAENRALTAEALATQAQAACQTAEERLVRLLRRTEQAERQAEQAERQAEQAEMQTANAEARASHAAQDAAETRSQVSALLGSTSWRVTAPMRSVARILYTAGRWCGSNAGVGIRWLGARVRARPWLKKAILAMLQPFPTASWRLRTASFNPLPARNASDPLQEKHDLLPPRVRRIHSALIAEMARQKLRKDSDAHRD
jgi:FkbM family methyltransferase